MHFLKADTRDDVLNKKHQPMKNKLFLIVLIVLSSFSCTQDKKEKNSLVPQGIPDYTYNYKEWSDYLGGPGRNHYSDLIEITPENVSKLKVAWTYSAKDSGQMQMNPIIKDGILYGVTADLKAIALDAKTGKEIWNFGDPYKQWHSTSRGVSYWSKGDDKRILFTVGANLYALNALTGEPISTFGTNGAVDLHTGLPESAMNKFVISNTPGTVFKDLIIMPLRLSEGADAAPGDIKAFNIITGKLEWTFHTIPYPDEPGYETWEDKNAYKNINVGAANNWAGMAVDPKSGIVFVPTGSASPDFYGGNRKGSNLYANCLLALNANTGKKIWHYQFVHHDILDRDAPAPPNLIMVERDGQKIEAVAQITKQGYVFVFERTTGKPLFDIIEEEVPASVLEGEEAWKTQPKPVLPKPYSRISSELTENDINPYSEDKDSLLKLFQRADKRWFAPPNTEPVFLFPGYDGGAEWGGAAADPDDGIIYVNSNETAWLLQLEKNDTKKVTSKGEGLFTMHCAACHKTDLSGYPASGYPSLVDVTKRITPNEISSLITTGRGRMVGFPQLSDDDKTSIINFLKGEDKKEINLVDELDIPKDPYRHTGYHPFVDSNGLPGISPPWGTLNAINLNTGNYLWSIPLGETLSLKEKGYPTTGTQNYGGPVVTASGLLFIAATKDSYFRAFNKKTGELLWETELPASGFATPSTYEIDGKQYIVIACGGGKLRTKKGNKIVAFALE